MSPWDVARRPRVAPAAPVSWRDGVHLTGTPIWCDARRRRDVCFVSSADRVGRAGHGQLIATPVTLALLGARGAGHLGVPPLRPFTLGTLRLELIPSGRTLGAAALHVDVSGRTALYAGAVRTTGTTDGAQVRASDAVVVAAPFGEVRHKFAPVDKVAEEVVDWVTAQLAADRRPILVVDTATDGLEVAARLAAADLVVAGSRSLRDAALRLGELVSVPQIRAPGKEPGVVIRVETDRVKVSEAEHPVAALVSPRAIDEAKGWNGAFAWPFVAGREQLLAWIDQTRAHDVFVTGACAETIVAKLGPRARMLGPPHQMMLFPQAAP
jgi:putative mRNA 3-end processing factor